MVNAKFAITLAMAYSGAMAASLPRPGLNPSPAAVQECAKRDAACRTAPGANMAVCSSENAMCESAINRQCEQDFQQCRRSPDANISTCAADKSKCDRLSLEILSGGSSSSTTPVASSSATPTPSLGPSQATAPQCVIQGCTDRDNACRTAPGANMAVCASKNAMCQDAATLQCESSYAKCQQNGGDDANCKAQRRDCNILSHSLHSCTSLTSSTPVATPSATPATGSSDCEQEYNACRTAPGANMAVCAARKANCDEKTGPTASSTATPSITPTSLPNMPVFTGAASRTGAVSISTLGLVAIALGFF
ncbi:hypothetical protein BDV59DRAFT_199838 [Aspergillus ambiguus]|uniref:uncharacterized protein n=1 Tax=Aspergillus ambiguus TaxID=176160 RepID=UPI003CCD13B5